MADEPFRGQLNLSLDGPSKSEIHKVFASRADTAGMSEWNMSDQNVSEQELSAELHEGPSILLGQLCGALAAVIVFLPSLKLSWRYLDGRESGKTVGDALVGLVVNSVGTVVFTAIACVATWLLVSIAVNAAVDSNRTNESAKAPNNNLP